MVVPAPRRRRPSSVSSLVHADVSLIAMMAIIVSTLAALPRSSSFVPQSSSIATRKYPTFAAIASPLDQLKVDFVGSLENAYDLNPSNAASASFLDRLGEQVTPQSLTRLMVESFDQLGAGKWRIVYTEEYSTSFGFGSLFGDMTACEVELIDGSITSILQCVNKQSPYQLTIRGDVGTAGNSMLVKVRDVQTRQMSGESENDGLLRELKEAPVSVMQQIVEKSWPRMFAGVSIVDVLYLDQDFVVFDFDFLARAKGRRICARKEPDFF